MKQLCDFIKWSARKTAFKLTGSTDTTESEERNFVVHKTHQDARQSENSDAGDESPF